MIEIFSDLTAADITRLIRKGEMSAIAVAETALDRADTDGKRLNAIITLCRDKAIKQAAAIDSIIKSGGHLPPLAGVPVILKDNIILSDYPTTCGSRMLESYIPPYDSTCADRLEKAGAVIIGKANMDEFGMGSSNEFSAFGSVRNPRDENRVPGGSSGGSAACVGAGIVPIAFGSDTGGSVRQPAGFCGVVGLRPTYGSVSRYGLVAFASSTDQIGPMSGNVKDCAMAFEAIAGYDRNDSTSLDYRHPAFGQLDGKGRDKKFSFGLPRECFQSVLDPEVRALVESAAEKLGGAGHRIVDSSLPHTDQAVAAYYIIANAEASSNLARFDGIRFGYSAGQEKDLAQMYSVTRGRGFGREVVRRIILGTYVLSAGYYDRYYQKAQKTRQLIRQDFDNLFEKVDLILSPTSPTPAFRLNEKINDPLAMYLSDIYTIPASLAGLPAISVPCGKTATGLPVGLQITAPACGEADLLIAAGQLENLLESSNADD